LSSASDRYVWPLILISMAKATLLCSLSSLRDECGEESLRLGRLHERPFQIGAPDFEGTISPEILVSGVTTCFS
jgi:hypothetical protein